MPELYWSVVPSRRNFCTVALFLASAMIAAGFSGCNRGRKPLEIAYVSAPQATLRDRVAAFYTKTGTVKNGDRVQVLERERRFVRVRTAAGAEGWIEQRYLVNQQVFDGFRQLAQEAQNTPVQGAGTTRNDTNLHLEPGRETQHLYQLTQGTKVLILKRSTAEKNLPEGVTKPVSEGTNESKKPAAPMEDWWLIRDANGQVGWVLARMIDLDVPLEIAQYAEGQRIVAFFVLDQVNDGDKKVPQYLVALTEPYDGLPFDYNQIRVFTWNVRRHRYETAYREHKLEGVLPITVSQENFEKEGTLPVFILQVKDDDGKVSERKYKLNTPIVRRVLAPGEEPVKAARRKSRH
jgi:SH3-like domain-containing protein